MAPLTAYLDTCIVSGIAKQDLKPEQQKAMSEILKNRKEGKVFIVTSRIAKDEIEKIPEQYRGSHESIYYLIADVPVARTVTIYPGGSMGLGMGLSLGASTPVPDPIYIALKNLLRDEKDAEHIFQASKNNIQYFITTDERTILSYSDKIVKISNVKVISPIEFNEIFHQ
ncbi:hypothetical protein PITCH_A1020002 [uncultured Desulfobacterium sp.]|uniref:PIN domain-containing protein n=1 Tax=uncultured Desulfobacterium sp. TaxID=201089 RepID=A0A445MQK9_9BACT|nr:hypothetical protein PITCH_A1020002 [uncultured Desulfobacterium sp.]